MKLISSPSVYFAPSPARASPKKAQIAIKEAEHLYKEVRVENVLSDDNGETDSLKPGAKLDVILEADTRPSLFSIRNICEEPGLNRTHTDKRHQQMPSGAASDPMAQQSETVFHDLQRDLASRSKYGRLRRAKQSSHYIQRDQPEVVLHGIMDVIRENKRIGVEKPGD